MTDDLVKRLRDFDPHNMHEWEAVDLAADRIEQLEQRLEATKDKAEAAILDLMAERDRAKALLDKAVDALQTLLATAPADDHAGWYDALKEARAVLAEIAPYGLEGGKTNG